MKIGLIGCGWIVERGHAPSLSHVPGLQVAATADPSGDRAARLGASFGLNAQDCYYDYRELLARRDIDIVSVATPPGVRRDIVTLAAEASKHVICEKPFATTLADADAMIEACHRHGVTLAMYHNYLYYPETIKARELIARGAIGEVVATQVTGLRGRPWSGAEEYQPGWRHDLRRSGGGVLMDAGVHGIYLTETYHRQAITAVSAAIRYGDSGVDTYAFCRFQLGSSVGLLNVAWAHGGAGVSILGTAGYLEYVFDEGAGYFGRYVRAIRHFVEGQPTQTYALPYTPDYHDRAAPQLYDDLIHSISGTGPAYPAPGEAGRQALHVALAAYQSGASSCMVPLPLSPDDPVYVHGLAGLRS